MATFVSLLLALALAGAAIVIAMEFPAITQFVSAYREALETSVRQSTVRYSVVEHDYQSAVSSPVLPAPRSVAAPAATRREPRAYRSQAGRSRRAAA